MRLLGGLGLFAAVASRVPSLRHSTVRCCLQPQILRDRQDSPVTIRLAVPSDSAAVKASLADQSGTGSGTGDDEYMMQEFERNVADPNYTVLFVEQQQGAALGTMAIAWSSGTESYWEALRVAEAARGRGVAALLFQTAAQLALRRQGERSVSRWGLVSSNQIMTEWSERLGLEGPLLFRRYGAVAAGSEAGGGPAPPEKRIMRSAVPSDVDPILQALPSFLVASDGCGTQNFVRVGWAQFNADELTRGVAREPLRGIEPPAPLVLLDALSGRIVGFASLGRLNSPTQLAHGLKRLEHRAS